MKYPRKDWIDIMWKNTKSKFKDNPTHYTVNGMIYLLEPFKAKCYCPTCVRHRKSA